MNTKKIILASASPRRTELLSLAGINHKVIVLEHEEVIDNTKAPSDIVKSLAFQKANAVFEKHQDNIVLGADTIVVLDEILGKPKDYQDAFRMLKKLQGKTHQVMTGVAILSKEKKVVFYESTNVTFKKMTDEEIYSYIEEENVYDKAGAYAIQGSACKYITKIEGDYYNVMGLPIQKVYTELKNIDKTTLPKNHVVVVGGSNLDYIGNLPSDFNISESNIGTVDVYFGGVSRNIVENLARNGVELSFITCIASDALGKAMKDELESLGVDLYIPSIVEKTGSFLSLNTDNNLFVGICDVDYQNSLTKEYVESLNVINENTKYLVIDTNLPQPLIEYLCEKYQDKFIISDGISSKKVVRLKNVLNKISLLKVNIYEGKTLTGYEEPELIMKSLINQGVKNCVITSGSNATLYNIGNKIMLEPVIKADNVVNTTGAGDAMLSGVIKGLVSNKTMKEAVQIGHMFANKNLQVKTPTVKE